MITFGIVQWDDISFFEYVRILSFIILLCVIYSFRPQRNEGQDQFGAPRVYHQNHQYQYPDFGQTNRYDHPRQLREYRPGNGAPRTNAMGNTATYINSNKSQYHGNGGPSGPRYNNYASKYDTVSQMKWHEFTL